VSAVFLGEPVVGQDVPHEPGTDRMVHLGEGVSDLIQSAIGFEPRADDARFNLLGAYRWAAGAPPCGEKVGEAPLEDSLTAIVIGLACLEAAASGALTFGETTEVPQGDHADVLLDALFLGKGDGLGRYDP